MKAEEVDPLRAHQKGILPVGFDDIKSSVGPQCSSAKVTAPSVHFGTSSRPAIKKVGGDVPGPGHYPIPSSIGHSVDSRTKSAPAFSVRGREKFGSTANLKEAANTPGPGAHVSKIVNPNERRAPAYPLGKRWTPAKEGIKTPGPGDYENLTSVGLQKTAGSATFGTGERPPLLLESTGDVGPGEYKIDMHATGPQPLSTKKTAAAFSFSVAGRKHAPIGSKMSHDEGPGPGTYKRYNAIGKQSLSSYKSAPASSMSGRTKFGSCI